MHDCGGVLRLPHIALSSRRHTKYAGSVERRVPRAYANLGGELAKGTRGRTSSRYPINHAKSSF